VQSTWERGSRRHISPQTDFAVSDPGQRPLADATQASIWAAIIPVRYVRHTGFAVLTYRATANTHSVRIHRQLDSISRCQASSVGPVGEQLYQWSPAGAGRRHSSSPAREKLTCPGESILISDVWRSARHYVAGQPQFQSVSRYASAHWQRVYLSPLLRDDLMLDPLDLCEAPLLLGPAPCDKCSLRNRCGQELLACESYTLFVRENGPNRWAIAPRAPTRARYLSLFSVRAREADQPVVRWLHGQL
jgi:hypothetical protein